MNPLEPTTEEQAALFAEQMRHALDLLRAEVDALRALHDHDLAMANHRLGSLETAVRDHELRIRADTDGVTQFKMWAGLASGSSGLMALAALIRSFFGGG
jgi:phage head maturation protease